MEKEAYVSYETAELLKKNENFNICTKSFYKTGNHTLRHNTCALAYYAFPNKLPAPTHQAALAWLREDMSIFVEIEVFQPYKVRKDLTYSRVIAEKPKYSYNIQGLNHNYCEGYGNGFHTYEGAVEAAITYCLTHLIKDVL